MQPKLEKRAKRAEAPFASNVGRFLARVLQTLVRALEALIEWLGQEPERKWESVLFLKDLHLRAPDSATLLKRADLLVERGDSEGALRLYVKVLEVEPDNTRVLDSAAEVLAELGDVDGAKELVAKSIELAPRSSHGKFVLLGHLQCGENAIKSFENALDLLNLQLHRLGDTSLIESDLDVRAERVRIKKSMSEVLTAIAKVYLTDCASLRDAERFTEDLLDQSLIYDPENPESTQALADLRVSQGRKGEALVLVRRTMQICSGVDDGRAPSFDFRCVTARLLVELSQYEIAQGVLEELAREDDEDTEVLYLLGLCYLLENQPKQCRGVLSRAKRLLEANRDADHILIQQINELLERRSISEEEKTVFWNPRWWIGADGTASTTSPTSLEQSASSSSSKPSGKSSGFSIPIIKTSFSTIVEDTKNLKSHSECPFTQLNLAI
mmetsp:Transcript_25220/g.34756  ORF Transcript_25220/g.34756 Transcript_25220/m.34756 type:complete len:441 (+) Transcript_25220:149-1471(+)|eukprot:CAMPEP_0196600354 /NCGR_PEP_ID=MMETSP1081-20130531/95344_1 /TAXON_ID=36882 /ORGANISM="Pyramimonas amylifera, Strain CCMP720" /LENGTH=440 /DNA_ID=CAMNT_0041926187 /DNA_START=513 /DNA_END=1835 /DNA_ORIENTATION=-